MSKEVLGKMKWQRPDSVEYPKVWHRFKARDVDSDELVEYRIEDLSESRIDDVWKHMRENYLPDEPITRALGGGNDDDHFEDYKKACKLILDQKMPLVCYREGSNDVVGTNWIFVSQKDDKLFDQIHATSKNPITKALFEIVHILYEKFDPYETYGINEYMSSLGLTVDIGHIDRSIGDQFLATRRKVCKEFGFKLTSTVFPSNYSSRNAENVGFKTDIAVRYDEVMKILPEYDLSDITSSEMTIKTLVF